MSKTSAEEGASQPPSRVAERYENAQEAKQVAGLPVLRPQELALGNENDDEEKAKHNFKPTLSRAKNNGGHSLQLSPASKGFAAAQTLQNDCKSTAQKGSRLLSPESNGAASGCQQAKVRGHPADSHNSRFDLSTVQQEGSAAPSMTSVSELEEPATIQLESRARSPLGQASVAQSSHAHRQVDASRAKTPLSH